MTDKHGKLIQFGSYVKIHHVSFSNGEPVEICAYGRVTTAEQDRVAVGEMFWMYPYYGNHGLQAMVIANAMFLELIESRETYDQMIMLEMLEKHD